MRTRLHSDDERGATLVIVVLSLIAMMGMIVLVVDVGGVLWKRRELINGADAAALAAAKSCADSGDTAVASDIALQYANDNVTDSGSIPLGGGVVEVENCDNGPGFITVQYTQDKKLFFAPVLGFGDEGEVAGKATAAWGPIGGGNAVPIVIEAGALQGPCQIPEGAEKGDTCPLWYNNGNDALGAAQWGYLNLSDRGWNVVDDAHCPSSGSSDRRDWILNNYTDAPRVLAGDPPGSDFTYVCADSGHSSANWQDLVDRMDKDPYLLFPVNDCDAQVDKNGNNAPCGTAPDKYAIVGFIRLKLVKVLQGDDPEAIGSTGPSGTCQGQHAPITSSATGPEIELSPFGISLGCFSSTPDDFGGLQIFHMKQKKPGDPWGKTNGQYVQCGAVPTNCDYVYDPLAGTVEWVGLNTDPAPVWVEFSWSNDGSPGICGQRDSDPNAICIQMEYQGFTTNGGFVGGGADFGTYGYVLCDRDLETCPDQQS